MRVFILAGGLGTRIRSEFPDVPKPLVPICGKPFLERQLQLLAAQGFDEFTLCVGYRAQQIIEHFGTGAAWKISITYSVEPTPLGTAGALKYASSAFHETALILNGDTYLDINYHAVIDCHNRQSTGIIGTLAITQVPNSARSGEVIMADDGRIITFQEKVNGRGEPGLINAGAYVLKPQVLDYIQNGRGSSLEREIFPALATAGQLYGAIVTGRFVDIGTPEGYAELARVLT